MVHLVGGEADQDIGDGGLDGLAGFGALDGELVVGEDGRHVGDDVVMAGVGVVRGVGPAADSGFFVDPDALVRFAGFLVELWQERHETPPPGIYGRFVDTAGGCGLVYTVWYRPGWARFEVRGSRFEVRGSRFEERLSRMRDWVAWVKWEGPTLVAPGLFLFLFPTTSLLSGAKLDCTFLTFIFRLI
jgi:hypothetical protein